MTVPCITIHGVGTHKENDIKTAIEANITKTPIADRLTVEEFNWYELVEHRSGGIRNLYWFLEKTAFNISAAARMGLDISANPLDRVLGKFQFKLHRIAQWLIAGGVAALIVGPIVTFQILLPIGKQFGSAAVTSDGIRWGTQTLEWLAYGILFAGALIVGVGMLRILTGLSLQPLVVTVRSVLLLFFQPLLVLLSVFLVYDWGFISIVVVFFGSIFLVIVAVKLAFGLFTDSLAVEALFAVKILVPSVLISVLLLGFRERIAKSWIQGPIGVLLDIFRYLGEPDYRVRVQTALNGKIKDARRDMKGGLEIVLLAHSLGTVIAVDSLINSDQWRCSDKVWLITMGSPLRRWFLHLFPGILFPNNMSCLALMAASRVAELRWLNVYRPLDYVGKSLGLNSAGVGRDRSTGQLSRILSSHSDYWGDSGNSVVGNSVVLETVLGGLEELTPIMHAKPNVETRTSYILPNPPKRTNEQIGIFKAINISLSVIFVGLYVGNLCWMANGSPTDWGFKTYIDWVAVGFIITSFGMVPIVFGLMLFRILLGHGEPLSWTRPTNGG